MTPKLRTLLALIAVIVPLDQITKSLVSAYIERGSYWVPIEMLDGFFRVTHARNPGGALGLAQGLPVIVFVVLALVALVMIGSFFRRIEPGDRLSAVSLGLIVSGAVGNLIDRILRGGEVVDFLQFDLRALRLSGFQRGRFCDRDRRRAAAPRCRHPRDRGRRQPLEPARGEGRLSPKAYVGVGANLGAAEAQVRAAIAELWSWGPCRASSLWRTEPLAEPGSAAPQGWFVNAVVEIELEGDASACLDRLLALERRFGRPAQRERWAPRRLDLDLLIFGDLELRTDALTVPHPGLASRRFVLAPLAELAPGLVAPGQKRTVAALLADLDDPLRVEKL